jgi:hypothetical protein
LQDYEQAGRLDVAIASVVQQTAAAANAAEEELLEIQIKHFDVAATESVFDRIEALTAEQAMLLASSPPYDYPQAELDAAGDKEAAAQSGEDAKRYLRNLVLNRPDKRVMEAWVKRLDELEGSGSQSAAAEPDMDAPAATSEADASAEELERIRGAELDGMTRADLAAIQRKLGLPQQDGIWGVNSQRQLDAAAEAERLGLAETDTTLTKAVIEKIRAAPE